MTELGGHDPRPSRDRLKVRAEVAPPTPAPPHGEVHDEGRRLVGTFWLPHHDPREVKFHVGRRTITIWSRKEGQEFQTILVLSKWVNPETFILAHKNGLYEFLLDAIPDKEKPRAGGP